MYKTRASITFELGMLLGRRRWMDLLRIYLRCTKLPSRFLGHDNVNMAQAKS